MEESEPSESANAPPQDPPSRADPPAVSMQESYPEEDEEQEQASKIKETMEETLEEQTNNDSKEQIKRENEEEEEEDLAMPNLGGNIDTKAYCLLDGIFEVRLLSWCICYNFLVPLSPNERMDEISTHRKMGIEHE